MYIKPINQNIRIIIKCPVKNKSLKMRKALFWSRYFMLLLLVLMLSNFSASAQKTTIWVVNHAESDDNSDKLSQTGEERAIDLEKRLKHEGVEVIYITAKNVSAATANPLAAKVKILPRVYTDSVQKFATIIKNNFIGKKVLIITNYNTILPLLAALGADTPFDSLDKEDYDQLFTVTIKPSGDVDCMVTTYGKKHHTNAIPQSYILDNYSQGLPGR